MTNKNISSPTATRIFASWLERGKSEPSRTYLGASIIGHECDMYLWLYFRGIVRESFDGRMYRLFDRGKREEAVFCDDLRRIGCEVKEFDEKGQQWSVSAFGGHFGGHLDGIVRGLSEAPAKWHVVEFKTHSDASFKKLYKEGVKKAKPVHYAQMTVYMGLTGLQDALYMAVNKDNDDLWVERLKFERADYDRIMARAKHIIDTCSPERCAARPDDYRCKACGCREICWHTSKQFVDPAVPVTCKTCCHATADTEHPGAYWTCRLGKSCPCGNCDHHIVLPLLVSGDLKDGDEDGIRYSFKHDGKEDSVTIGPRGVSTIEAQKFGPDQASTVLSVREVIPTSAVSAANTLKMKYADEKKYAEYFSGTTSELTEWILENPVADFANPIRTEEFDGVSYYEYAPSTLVAIDKKNATANVRFERPPF